MEPSQANTAAPTTSTLKALSTRPPMLDLTQFVGHTPGPWALTPGANDAGCISAHGEPYAKSVASVHFAPPGEWEANCRLIGAAPQLLAECRAARVTALFHHDALRVASQKIDELHAEVAELKRTGAAIRDRIRTCENEGALYVPKAEWQPVLAALARL